MAVNPKSPWRWAVPGAAAWLIAAAAGAAAEPVMPPAACAETHSALTASECGGGNPERKSAPAPAPQLPLQMLAPPPARSAPSTNTPAGALVPPAPGPARDHPIVAVP
ncbi:hypothetical protein [Nocardia blacklockiae]|uniref:hypothetical protein n=1 Tax=Nocardia blacklockiae TaxID=480036 RepID=UPI0018948F7F|nr:hypothetical protein [Nocardia blacklockiae]MBF6175463.1 hypothetical protein [Nocardia blacklockiae]